jgi:hypothetical protein
MNRDCSAAPLVLKKESVWKAQIFLFADEEAKIKCEIAQFNYVRTQCEEENRSLPPSRMQEDELPPLARARSCCLSRRGCETAAAAEGSKRGTAATGQECRILRLQMRTRSALCKGDSGGEGGGALAADADDDLAGNDASSVPPLGFLGFFAKSSCSGACSYYSSRAQAVTLLCFPEKKKCILLSSCQPTRTDNRSLTYGTHMSLSWASSVPVFPCLCSSRAGERRRRAVASRRRMEATR